MRVLVFGGRDFSDYTSLCTHLDAARALNPSIAMIIHGGARGADSLAGRWAIERGLHVAEVRAMWNFYGNSAGSLRNEAMLLLRPDAAIGFPGGRGSADMAARVKGAEIPLWLPMG